MSNKDQSDNRDKGDQRIATDAAENMLGPNPIVGFRSRDWLESMRTIGRAAATNPLLFMQHQAKFTGQFYKTLLNREVTEPPKRDRRFADAAWSNNYFYRTTREVWMAAHEEWHSWLNDTGIDGVDADRARFFIDLIFDAAAPSNSALSPAAVNKAIETGGGSLVDGARNMFTDMVEGGGMPSQVDQDAFDVGVNVATTQGKVVYRNDVLELIQYQPVTESVHARPLLIIPPQINKYYVFDLSPEKSLVQFLLSKGQQVFMVSWRNPTADQRDWGLDTYIAALEQALTATTAISDSPDVNLMGACSGGITLVTLLGYLQARGDNRVNAATLMVSMFDTDNDSQLGMFASDGAIEAARQASQAKGVLEGREMARIFAWMRAQDLVWNYWVNNYLLGNKPPAFDILYWNNDTTRLPAKFHSDMLDMFKTNPLVKSGELEVLGTTFDIGKLDCDVFALAGTTDHITPWKACYKSTRSLGGNVEFVLSSSGHIQSILNPPGNPKSKYFINGTDTDDADEWHRSATECAGTWWDYWSEWLAARAGETTAAPGTFGNQEFVPLDEAPGRYVLEP